MLKVLQIAEWLERNAGLPSRFELLLLSFSSSNDQVRVLSPVAFAHATRPVAAGQAQLADHRAIRRELVRGALRKTSEIIASQGPFRRRNAPIFAFRANFAFNLSVPEYCKSDNFKGLRTDLMATIITDHLPDITLHRDGYPAVDPTGALRGSASGKVVYITGASQGIGRATAVAFAQAGAEAIYLTARSEEALKETKSLVLAANSQTECAYMVCDVTDEEQVKSSIEDCVSRFGRMDAVDANAGYLDNWKRIGESDPGTWWKTWEVNMKGTYLVVRYSLPHLIQSAQKSAVAGGSGGHLILTSSVGAQRVNTTASDYQTSKHAINRLCEFVEVDHGAEGIKCFAIHPGGVRTALAENMPEEIKVNLVDAPELAAGFVVWLCSGEADWAKGRYLNCKWDVGELIKRKQEILDNDLLVNRLRTQP